MKFEIKSRFDQSVLFSIEIGSLKLAVEAAVKLRANLSGANLSGADLIGADLRSANLSGADLRRADLIGANLRSADLRSANLIGANLIGANLIGANLRSADLRSANLRSANLSGANLSGADLRSANLSGANLIGANLRSANLSGANLIGANLRSANLSGADLSGANLGSADLIGAKGIYMIVPEVGAFTAFKRLANGTIAKILIPEDADRVGGYTGRKCRASKAIVIEGAGPSSFDSNFTYAPGATVVPDSWDGNPQVECSHGIHFFLSRKEAEEYV